MTAGRARSFRTLFISDVHLGTKGCQADRLLDFLRHHDADTIYLVGNIVDGWQLRSSWYWPQAHNDVVQKLLRQARKGVRRHAVDGVICGHIHHAAIHDDFGVRYVNCGDWVESCSVIVEHFDGRLEVMSWTDEMRRTRPSASAVVRGEGRGAEIAA